METETPRPAEEHQGDMAVQAAVARVDHPEAQVVGSMGTRPGDHLGAHQVVRLEGIQVGLRAGLAAVAALTDQEVQEGQVETPAGPAEVAPAGADQVTLEAAALEIQAVDGQGEVPVEIGGPRILKWTG